jgi:NAD dependent epimerase/dehydratase
MRALVTGADGYIGSHVVQKLVDRGVSVLALAQYNSLGTAGWLDTLDASDSLEIEWGDIRDPGQMQTLCKDTDVVIHLAALITIPYSYSAPRSYIETNVLGTQNVLEGVNAAGVSRMIHISTSEVYGSAQTVPISETHSLVGQSPYSASKIGADQLAYSYWASFETPVVTVRPFNTYGPRQSNRAVIPSVITQLLEHPDFVDIGSLDTTRDLTYVLDTAEGIVKVAMGTGGEGHVYNLGTGDEWSIGKVLEMITDILGANPEIRSVAERTRPERSEVMRLVSDNTKVRNAFGWSPEFSGEDGLRRGLEKTVSWFQENLELYSNRSRLLL